MGTVDIHSPRFREIWAGFDVYGLVRPRLEGNWAEPWQDPDGHWHVQVHTVDFGSFASEEECEVAISAMASCVSARLELRYGS